MNTLTTRKPSMLVVRGARESCLAFYNTFRKMKIRYVAATQSPYATTVKLNEDIDLINKKFVPKYFVDPVSLIQRTVNNMSLVDIDDIENLVKSCDVVNLTDYYYSFNDQIVKLAKKYKKPVVTIIWTTIPSHITTRVPPYSLYSKSVIDNTDLFILRCQKALNFTDSVSIPRSKTTVIYKGVDLKHFHPSKKNKSANPLNILYVGVLHESKGVRELVGAFEKLLEDGYRVKLTVAGRGPMSNFISEKSKHLPINYLGFVTYDKLAEVYRNADIFCSPSKYLRFFGLKIWEEYFSYTLMEAQASGLPIVATDTGGIAEEVGSRNLLVKPENAQVLYLALRELVTNRRKREDIGLLNSKRAMKYFDAAKQAKLTENTILELLITTK